MRNHFWALYQTQLSAMFWNGKKNAKNKKGHKAKSAAGQIVAWIIAGAIIAVYEYFFIGLFYMEGATHLFPPLIALFAMFLTLMTTVAYAKMLIFESKDHDLLYSLPISGRTIVAAKLAVMYTLDSILNIIIMIPCGIYYGIMAKPSVTFYIYYFVLMLFVTLIPILFASIVSALLSLIASRFRHAQVVSLLFYVLFLGGVMSLSFLSGASAGSEGEAAMVTPMIGAILDGVGKYYLPLAWFREATMEGSLSSALLFVGVSLLCFAVVALVFGKFYGKIHETFRPRVFRRKYKASEKSSGAIGALMKKDLKHLFSSANVAMNQLTGLLMLVIFAIMFTIMDFGAEGAEEAAGMAEFFAILFPFIFAMAATMVCDTSTSISLEGKTFPLLKSLPVRPVTILRAKLSVHMLLTAPVIILCGVAVSILNGLPVVGAVATVIIPLCYAYTSGIVGLLINLKKYKFDWTSEINIAKNNLPMVLTMIGGMLLSVIPMILAIFLMVLVESLAIILGIFTALSVAVAIVMTLVMNAVGEKWFLAIEY